MSVEELNEIKDCLRMARNTFLGITALDTPEERKEKTAKNETAIVRYINRCLKYFDESELESNINSDIKQFNKPPFESAMDVV